MLPLLVSSPLAQADIPEADRAAIEGQAAGLSAAALLLLAAKKRREQ